MVETDDGSAVVAKGTSAGGRDHVPVVGPLRAGQRLVASQTLGSESSPSTPRNLAVTVSPSPTSHAQLPPMSFKSKLYACGAAVWLTGAAPGAVVSVSAGGSVIGTGRADSGGDARLPLSTRLPPAGAVVTAVQDAPPGFASLAGSPQQAQGQTIPLPLGRLPTPLIEDPRPMGCEAFVRIGGVVDGAEVTVTRASDGSKATATFDLGELWFSLPNAFPPTGDRIEVSQRLPPNCKELPSDSAFADVRPAEAPAALEVAPPCAGSTCVHVRHLRPGATLTVSVDGNDPLRYVVPPERTTWDVPVDALPAAAHLVVKLEVCGFSTSSGVDVVGDTPPPRPEVVEPLYSCGRAVSVKTRAGTYLELWADYGSGPRVQISTRAYASTDLRTIGVSPFLSVPESVQARQLSCGGAWLDSASVGVKPHPRLRPLELHEPVEGDHAVLPTNVVSGAHVTVWSANRRSGQEILGERDVTQADPVVGLVRELSTDDTVWALEEMCGDRTTEGNHYDVMPGFAYFKLPHPQEQLSGESLDGKVVVHTALLACRFRDGAWVFYADVENTETGYDCSLVFGVDLDLPTPLVFGESLDVDVAAAAGGLPQGLASLGYPSRWTQTKRGSESRFRNPAFWKEVLKATARWHMIVAWRNYAPVPEKPEWVKQGPPDPNQLFPPLPTEEDDD